MSDTTGRVLVIGVNYPPEHTGIAPYTGDFCAVLGRHGKPISVITTFPHYPNWRVFEGYSGWGMEQNIDGVLVHRVAHYVPRKPTGMARLVSEVTFGLRTVITKWPSSESVIFVSPAMVASWLGLLRQRLIHPKKKSIVWVQDLYWLGMRETNQGSKFATALIGMIEKNLLTKTDTVVCIHPRMAERISNEYGVPKERIAVIRNWTHIGGGVNPSQAETDAIRVTHGWDAEDFVVLHTGNMGTKQDLENVVEAARLASARQSKVTFVLMGDGHERARLQTIGSGINRLQFLEPVDSSVFLNTLKAADALLVNELPGLLDMAVPSKLTSYFAAGLPVLAATGEASVTADEVRASGAGIVVEAGNPEMLLAGAEALARDPEAAQMGSNGVQYMQQHLSQEVAIKAFMELLQPR